MQIFNSITKTKEDFKFFGDKIKIYVCGPTVYDYLHIGNSRPLIVFDTLRRYLKDLYYEYDIDFVQNFTDIDDKIIKKALNENKTSEEIAEKYMQEAIVDIQGLNILPYTHSPRVTEEIPAIIQMIDVLVKKGNAYEIDGNVYFDSKSCEYGILKNINNDELQTRLENNTNNTKKHETDFVLWKAKKDGEPFYKSPWGDGRPGWHIECSAIIKKYLGDTIDIHCGGSDLLFPHHENEIAQSSCANNTNLANYFMHNGFINIDDEKMSKSLGNFLTIRDIANNFGYNTLRFFILSSHYRSIINYSNESLISAKNGLERINQFIQNLKFLIKTKNTVQVNLQQDFYDKSDEISLNFHLAMQDDLNTSLAISTIFDYIKFVNTNGEKICVELLTEIYEEIKKFLNILGIKLHENKDISTEIEDLIKQREDARKNKNFKLADEIREKILNLGVTIEDTRAGVRWKYNE